MTNQPPRTRAELIDFATQRLQDEYYNPMNKRKLHATCSDFMQCIEDWLKTDWERLCEIYHIHPPVRENIVGMFMITMFEVLTKPEHRISANKYTAEGWRKTGEALVDVLQAKMGRVWDEVYPTFNPPQRVRSPVLDGVLNVREKEIG